jgi:tetratricopeptide (TPR) repeat protein
MSDIKFPPAYQKFWMAFEISTTKLRVFRFLFFALFALDAWLQIAHAPRYGANDFNVTHFPAIDFLFPMPSRTMMIVVFGVQAYLGMRLAFGGVSRATYIALAAFFAFGYYISQLNSLQHHYLLSIALCFIAAFPWPELQRPIESKKATPREVKGQRQRNWPVRMLLVSLSVMYFFAAVSKLHPMWLDGTTLKLELSAEWMRDIADWFGWDKLAYLTILTELFLMVAIQVRRLWPLAIVVGLTMHLSFEFSGLDIGLFSYFMVTIYFLLVPETLLKKVASWTAPIFAGLSGLLRRANEQRLYALLALAASLAVAFTVAQLLPLPVSTVTILLAITTALAAVDFLLVRRGASASLTHLAATFSLVFFLHSTDAIRDYYRYWGGQERRSGNISSAIVAYEDLVRFDPSYAQGHRRLGDLYRRAKRDDEALREYELGLKLDPTNFHINKAAAQLYHIKGMGKEALACAQRGLLKESNDQALRSIRDHWKKTGL